MNDSTSFPYLHGFSHEEQQRLRQQGRFAEYAVYRNVDFTNAQHILEVGCGVGAQSEILLRRFPDIKLTGIDFNKQQLDVANKYLSSLDYTKNRFNIMEMDAMNMKFEANQFDGAFLCWVLEHVPDPLRVLSEVRRVLKSGSRVFITEVMNSTFFIDPYSPNVWKYWMAFNDYQYDNAGDPFVGAKLGNLLTSLGYSQIKTKIFTWHLDNRQPSKRKEMFDYWLALMLSASEQLKKSKYIDEETIQAAIKEMNEVKTNPNAVFLYSFMQAEATVLPMGS
jgi:ubiquinone/menaquinone biosynthesis C-methylase UbiE